MLFSCDSGGKQTNFFKLTQEKENLKNQNNTLKQIHLPCRRPRRTSEFHLGEVLDEEHTHARSDDAHVLVVDAPEDQYRELLDLTRQKSDTQTKKKINTQDWKKKANGTTQIKQTNERNCSLSTCQSHLE
jgi:hypothetical protein